MSRAVHCKRQKNHRIKRNSDNETLAIANSYDGDEHPVMKRYDWEILAKSIYVLSSRIVKEKKINLSAHGDSLSTTCSNCERKAETVDKVLHDYSAEKCYLKKSLKLLEEIMYIILC